MLSSRQTRIFIAIVAILTIFVPLSGLPPMYKEVLTIVFGALILLATVHRTLFVRTSRLWYDLRESRESTREHELSLVEKDGVEEETDNEEKTDEGERK